MTRGARLREEILKLVGEYHAEAFGEAPPFNPGKSRVPYAGRVFDAAEMRSLVDASLEFWLTAGRFTRDFEAGLASFLGVPHALLVGSGSSANLLAFMALTDESLGDRRIARGDEVITVAAGFPTTVAPIVQYGAVPVFVDVSLPTYNVDCGLLEAALSPRTRAVMLAHTLGNPFDIGPVTEFCRKHGLWLVEDNCDALGSLYRGRLTGTFGDIGTSSFYPPHHLTTGEGGAVYTRDPRLAEILLSLRDWGRDCTCPSGRDNSCGKRFTQRHGELPYGYDHKYVYSRFGYNLKATDLQAAVGCAQLEKLPGFVAARRRNFARLREALAGAEDRLVLPAATPGSEPSWFGFPVTVREGAPFTRDQIVTGLEGRNIQTRALFAGNLVRHPCFDGMRRAGSGYRVAGTLAATDRIMNDTLWVGVYPGLTGAQVDFVGETLASLAREGR